MGKKYVSESYLTKVSGIVIKLLKRKYINPTKKNWFKKKTIYVLN